MNIKYDNTIVESMKQAFAGAVRLMEKYP